MKHDLSAESQTWLSTLGVLSVSFLPLSVYWVCVYIIWPWRYFDCFDPEGIHFAAGLSILRGFGPGNVDNPATPLQSLSAILSWLFGFGILDLERFRPFAYLVTIALRIIAACVLMRVVVPDLPVSWQIPLLWLPWLAPEFSMMSRQWCPETLYFPLGALAVAAIFHNFNDETQWQKVLYVGAVIGVMIGVKFIFVTWAAAAFLSILVTTRSEIAIKSCIALGAGATSGFVVATLPAISRYPRMIQWLFGLATRTGQYGTGGSGIVDLNQVNVSLAEILLHQKTWTILVTLIIAAILIRKPRTRVSIFCLFAFLASYALSLKHFAPRYLAPTGLLMLLAAAELLRGRRMILSNSNGMCASIAVGLLLLKSLSFDVGLHRVFVTERLESKKALDAFLEKHGRTETSVILYGWRAFVPSYTVRFMSRGENHRFDDEAEAAFPNEGIVDTWPDAVWFPKGKTSWEFIVVGKEFGAILDPLGLEHLRQDYPSWVVSGYIVIKNSSLAPSPNP